MAKIIIMNKDVKIISKEVNFTTMKDLKNSAIALINNETMSVRLLVSDVIYNYDMISNCWIS